VVGRLARKALDADDQAPVEQLVREGPTTVRPSEELDPLIGRMRDADVDALIVTSSDGRLLGIFERVHGEQAMREFG
jgi:predicted transcriptional regulator